MAGYALPLGHLQLKSVQSAQSVSKYARQYGDVVNKNRFTKNVPGDFYTNGECMACDLPEAEARHLMSVLTDDNYDTYFVKQPKTDVEITQAIAASHVFSTSQNDLTIFNHRTCLPLNARRGCTICIAAISPQQTKER